MIDFIVGMLSDQGSTGGYVWVFAASGGTPKDLTPSATISPSDLAWTAAPHQLVVSAWASGASDIVSLDTWTGDARTLARISRRHVTGGAFSSSVFVRTMAKRSSSCTRIPEESRRKSGLVRRNIWSK